MENKAFIRRRFTAVSNTLYYQDWKRLFNIASAPFTRRGSYFGIYAQPMSGEIYGQAHVYLGSRHGAVANNPDNNLMDMAPIYNGRKVPYAVMTSATEPDPADTLRKHILLFCGKDADAGQGR